MDFNDPSKQNMQPAAIMNPCVLRTLLQFQASRRWNTTLLGCCRTDLLCRRVLFNVAITFLAGYLFGDGDVDVVLQSPWGVGCERSYSRATAKARMAQTLRPYNGGDIISASMFDSENRSEWSTRKNGSKINEVQDGSASLLDSQGIYGKRFVGGKNFEHSLFRSITRRHLLGILPLQELELRCPEWDLSTPCFTPHVLPRSKSGSKSESQGL